MGPVGGALGALVLLTPTNSLHPATADALRSIDPDLVVLVGGLEATLAGVIRGDVDGRDTLMFAGMNVQVVTAPATPTATATGWATSSSAAFGDAGLSTRSTHADCGR